MKIFDLTMRVSAHDNLTEQQLMERFDPFCDAIPNTINKLLFRGDICLVEVIVEEKINNDNEIIKPKSHLPGYLSKIQ